MREIKNESKPMYFYFCEDLKRGQRVCKNLIYSMLHHFEKARERKVPAHIIIMMCLDGRKLSSIETS
jgi:hypothetical protein